MGLTVCGDKNVFLIVTANCARSERGLILILWICFLVLVDNGFPLSGFSPDRQSQINVILFEL